MSLDIHNIVIDKLKPSGAIGNIYRIGKSEQTPTVFNNTHRSSIQVNPEVAASSEYIMVKKVVINASAGMTGPKGDSGTDGASAYQIWLNQGNTGTELEFIESLKVKGDKGDVGLRGDTGASGSPGTSAYQIWLNQGNTGTELEFIESLKVKGDTGPKGDKGDKGDTGNSGSSAYQIWLNQGNTGTELEFIESLKVKGDKGDVGPKGDTGIGIKGDQGAQGPKGDAGTSIPYTLMCSESLEAGDFINIWNDNGTAKIRKAVFSSSDMLVDGYVLNAYSSSSLATFYQAGENTLANTGTPGATAYASSVPGKASCVCPEIRSGNWLQEIGKYISANIIAFNKGLTIQLR